jgi:hypothetical protein
VVPPEGRSGVTVPNVAAGEKVDASQVVQAPERTVAAGGRPGAVDTGRYNASAGNEAALLNEKYLAELNRGPTSWGASPEREQRQHVTLQQQVGADPSIIAEQKAIETGPGDLVRDELAAKPPPPARYEPKQILQLFQPSPESVAAFERANGRKLTEKDRIGWATALAADLSAKGLSPSSAAATRNPSVSVVPLDDESRQRVIDSLEKPNIEARAKWDREEAARLESLRGAVKATAAQNGTPEGGLVDLEKRGKIIDRGIAEEEAATHLQLAKIHEDSAKQQEADYRAKLEEKTPGAIGGFLSGIAQIMGATASGINGRPNAALAVLLDQDARRIAKFSESTAQRLGLEGARLKQVEEELLAKKSLGLGAQQQLSADKMLAEVRLRRAKNDEERSALARGAKSTASAVIPARAAGSGGGTSLDKLIAIAKQRRELEKEGVEVGSKAAESGAKSISERGVLNGVTYHLGNVTSPSEGAKARSQLGSLDKMEQTLKLLEEQAKAYGTRTWNPGRFENLVQEFTYDASNAKDQGVVRDPEMQAKLKSLGSWTGGQDVINDMRKITNISRRALTTQLGAVPVK